MAGLLQSFAEEFRQLLYGLVHIFRYPVGLYVGRSGDEEQFLVLRARGFAETLFRHVERVGDAACHHQQRLVDEVHPFAGVECHQVDQAALGVAEGGAGMRMRLEIILVAVGFLLAGGTGIGKALLHVIYLRVEESVAAHQPCVEHAQRSNRLEPLVGLCGLERVDVGGYF